MGGLSRFGALKPFQVVGILQVKTPHVWKVGTAGEAPGTLVYYPFLKAERVSFASRTRLLLLNAGRDRVCAVSHPQPANRPCVKTHKPQINLKRGESKKNRCNKLLTSRGSREKLRKRRLRAAEGGSLCPGERRRDSVCSSSPEVAATSLYLGAPMALTLTCMHSFLLFP